MKANKSKWIPTNWTFDDPAVAARFEQHVREQLPWYDVLTATIVHAAAHYIGKGGLVYDIGASTGNFGRAIEPYLRDRGARLVSIESSPDMAKIWKGPGLLIKADCLAVDYDTFDFAACILVLMFLPIGERERFVQRLIERVKPGGALVIVDKVVAPDGYLGTVFRRMAIKWKLDAGTSAEEIIAKELSLGGVQRPINPGMIPVLAKKFFQFGEFVGWIYERPEGGSFS